MAVMTGKVVSDSESIREAITRITRQILDRNSTCRDLKVIGVRTRGVHLAERISERIEEIAGSRPELGVVDITLYRDDVRRKSEWPKVKRTDISFSVENKNVVLVDDVIYTGRSSRAAMETVMDYGRPNSIQLAVLVDRGHRELPIQPDYVGFTLDTYPGQRVMVHLKELDGKDEVLVVEE